MDIREIVAIGCRRIRSPHLLTKYGKNWRRYLIFVDLHLQVVDLHPSGIKWFLLLFNSVSFQYNHRTKWAHGPLVGNHHSIGLASPMNPYTLRLVFIVCCLVQVLYHHAIFLLGIARKGSSCELKSEWQGYKCTGDSYQYRMMVIESLDADTETRRLSPVAVKVGQTIDLVNGGLIFLRSNFNHMMRN